MKLVICPHCKNHRLVTTSLPKDVIVVIRCPACHEYVVLFREKVVAVSRDILKNGSNEERRTHLAQVIDEFLEPDMFVQSSDPDSSEKNVESGDETEDPFTELEVGDSGSPTGPISQQEFRHFVQVELKLINDPAYFRKHFGGEL